jgi:uncharacterized protein (DUF58 family)
MLALFVLLLLLLGLLYSPRLARGAVSLVAEQARLFPGRKGRGRLELHLRCPVPLYVRLEREGQSSLSLLPGGLRGLAWGEWRLREELHYSPRRRGEHPLPRVRVFVKDLLGLREHELELPQERASVLAYPEAFPLDSPEFRLTLLADGPEAAGGLEDPSRFTGVREYLPGDPLHRLHWKATAHWGRLMVREWARVKSSGVWLHLDLQAQGRPGEVYVEHAASLAASLLIAAERDGLAFGLSLAEHQIPLGRGAEHLARMLRALALAEAEEAPRAVPVPPPGVNLILLTQEASSGVIEGALRARARASRVHLIALPEGFYLRPGEGGRPVFGKTDGVLRLLKKRSLLEGEGVRVHILRGNQNIVSVSKAGYR